MTDSFDRLRKLVLADVAVQRAKKQGTYSDNHAKLVGAFLRERLEQRKTSISDFAKSLRIKPDVAEFLVNGDLPGSILSADFISNMATQLDYPLSALRIMWGLEESSAPASLAPPPSLPEIGAVAPKKR